MYHKVWNLNINIVDLQSTHVKIEDIHILGTNVFQLNWIFFLHQINLVSGMVKLKINFVNLGG